ncbi:hypothetical protein [Amycolatopsis australiensis]|uniref:Secreted protein n=1 Tax=Amycolatopsis australiensis TaxID=546364 RepID=A0A1K1T7W7_9PSEU|nr:hypothetical protein [Amycolatopsis australiensis]SFW92439.1 hypothetical protein SAMN04489730_8621 [Amycolatopsis australiensis]
MRPLILLDVDGPLSPWAAPRHAKPAGYVEHPLRLSRWSRKRLRIWLNPAHGPELLALAGTADAELAWATSWEHRANRQVGSAIGLPLLPVVEFPGPQPAWKFGPVGRFAAGRPPAWFDDDFDLFPAARTAFLDRRAGLPTELIPVDAHTGLPDEHFGHLQAWLSGL